LCVAKKTFLNLHRQYFEKKSKHSAAMSSASDDEEDLQLENQQLLKVALRSTHCGNDILQCVPAQMLAKNFVPDKAELANYGKNAAVHHEGIATWLPANHSVVTITGDRGKNVICLLHNNNLYECSDPRLDPLPQDTSFLAHATVDKDLSTRLLIFDAVNLPSLPPHHQTDPLERYKALLSFYNSLNWKLSENITLQWVGLPHFARNAFIDGSERVSVGHVVGGLVCLTQNPCKPTYYKREHCLSARRSGS